MASPLKDFHVLAGRSLCETGQAELSEPWSVSDLRWDKGHDKADQLFSGISDGTMGIQPDVGMVQTEHQSPPRGQSPRTGSAFPAQGPSSFSPGSLCIKSVPQQLSTDTPQPGNISLVSGPGFLFPPAAGRLFTSWATREAQVAEGYGKYTICKKFKYKRK